MASPQRILKDARAFLTAQAEGFDALGSENPEAAEQFDAVASGFREHEAELSKLSAVVESRDVVLNHVRASIETAINSERDKADNKGPFDNLLSALDMVLPLVPHE